jgi:hypothetical protein
LNKERKNFPPHLNPLPPGERKTKEASHEGARKKRTKEFRVPSPLMGEGEDEGERLE